MPQFLASVLEILPIGVAVKDAVSRKFVFANAAYEEFIGVPRNTAVGKTVFDIYPSRHFAQVIDDADTELFRSSERRIVREFAGETVSGLKRIARTERIAVRDHGGNALFSIAIIEDVTEQRQGQLDLEQTRKFLDSIIENIPVSVVVKNSTTRRFERVNRAFERFLGLPRDQILGRTVFDLYPSQDVARSIDDAETLLQESAENLVRRELDVTLPSGEGRRTETTRIALRDADGRPQYSVAVIDDITDRRASEQRIAHLALHDALTGLVNRVTLNERLENACARYHRHGILFNLLLLDLDRFKQVNDTMGHPAGDTLLRLVSERLKSAVRETDVVARLGGDEFAIVQWVDENQLQSAHGLSSRIVALLTKPFDIDGTEVRIGTSIGVALGAVHSTKAAELIKMADLALYKTKANGRNNYTFFDPAFMEVLNERNTFESELRAGITRNELEIFYEPIVDARTRRLVVAEAKLRWRHRTRGILQPDQFIPFAEECGLISQIGEWLLERACAEAVSWPEGVKVSVNVSAMQLRNPAIVDYVICSLAESGLPPDKLELEIPETALVQHGSDTLAILRQFKKLGASLALDRFGTGHSSLNQLTMFPFDTIKIDKSLIANMTKRADCAAIVAAALALSQSLDLGTTAAGVETSDQFRILSLAGVRTMQGGLFGRIGPAAELDFGRPFETMATRDVA